MGRLLLLGRNVNTDIIFRQIVFLGTVVAHVVQGPGIFNYENRNPLRFFVDNEHKYPKNTGQGIYDKKSHVKMLFMAGLALVIRDI